MIGELPEGWIETDLASVTVRVPSINPAAEPDREFLYVDISAVDRQTNTIAPSEVRRFLGADAPSRARRPINSGDVLFSNVRTNRRNVALVPSTLDAQVCSTGFTVLRSNGAALPEYLLRSVLTDQFTASISETQTGTHYPATSDSQVVKQRIRIAPLAEQRRIVAKVEALLAEVNTVRECLSRLPTILKRARQSVVAAACAGSLTEDWRSEHPDSRSPSLPPRASSSRKGRRGANLSGEDDLLIEGLPDLPERWVYARLDRLAAPETVVTYGIVLPGPEVSGGVPYVRQQDIEDGRIRLDELRHTTPEIAAKHTRSSLAEGDVLLCIIRNLRVAIVPRELNGANLTQGTVRIRPNALLVRGEYLAAYLSSVYAQGWMKQRYFGMDMPRINVEDARALPVALPPLDEQDEIVRMLSSITAGQESVSRRLELATGWVGKVEAAILQKAFAGELVPTEAELAQAEGRVYEPAPALVERVRARRVSTSSERRVPSTTATENVAARPGQVRDDHDNLLPTSNEASGRKETMTPARVRKPLADVLDRSPKGLSPEDLLQAAGYTIEEVEGFFADLALAVRSGAIVETRPDAGSVLLLRRRGRAR